ncbi:ABC transporter permease [Lactovum odontotermitis]
MNYIKRAFTSIIRRPGKSLILLILIFVLGNIIAGAVSVQQAARQTESSIRKGIGAATKIVPNFSKLEKMSPEETQNVKGLPVATIEKLGKSSYVKYYDYNATGYFYSETMKPYRAEETKEMRSGNDESGLPGFTTTGVQYNEMLPFREGNGKLLTGRLFSKAEVDSGAKVALITKQLAETNNLQVGDRIPMKNQVYNFEAEADGNEGMPAPIAVQDLELEVVGIYEPKQMVKKDDKSGITSWRNEDMVNTLYVPNKVVTDAKDFSDQEMVKAGGKTYDLFFEPVYVLKDPDDSAAFRKEAEAVIGEMFLVNDGDDKISSVAGPLSTIKWIAGIVLYVAIGATLVILSLLITLFLRDRKHEMGIYLSLGERRVKVAAQVVIETVTIALVGITLALFSGNLVAQKVSQTMLKNQMISEQQKKEKSGMMSVSYSSDDESDLSSEDVMKAYKVSLDADVVVAFYAIGLGTVLISTLIPIVYTVRLNPKKIML